MTATILISAGEASGDLYAASLVDALRARHPELSFFGCAGPRMRAAGVEAVVDSSSLAVVGLLEVVRQIPRIYGEFRKLVRAAKSRRPVLAILTDSPDFHLRVAKQLKKQNIPVIYLVAPQVWAWRKDRIPGMRRVIDRLLCIFPFEQTFFERHGIAAIYIGHPLTRLIAPTAKPMDLRRRFGVEPGTPLLALLPGSRAGEVARHLPGLLNAVQQIEAKLAVKCILALPEGFCSHADLSTFQERFSRSSIQVQEGQTWDVLACADLALAASGTVTIEACLLKTPMVTFYRVNRLSWLIGKLLVRVPFFSMVNIIAGRKVVPELIQNDFSGERMAAEAVSLLQDQGALARMRTDLGEVAKMLASSEDPMQVATQQIEQFFKEERVHVS